MNKVIFIITILLFSLSNSEGSDFFKKYPGNVSNCGYGLAISEEGIVGIAGLQFDGPTSRRIVHSQMDSEGKSTVLYTYDTGRPDDTISAIAPSGDGGFVLAATSSGISTFRDLLIFKVRANGSIAWKKILGTASQEIVYRITRIQGGYLLVGGAAIGSNVDALIIKIDDKGNLLWKKTYGDDSGSEVGYAIEPDGVGYIMAGLKDTRPLVLKLSSSGQVEWGRLITTQTYSSDGRVSILKSGGFYYLTGTSNRSGHSHGGPEHTGISVIKLGATGGWIWSREYHAKEASVMWHATPGRNGNVVIAGHSGSTTASALVFQISPVGKILWKRAYGAENSAIFDVALMNDGAIIATGCTGKERLELFLAKTDSRGNIPNACGKWQTIPLAVDIIRDQTTVFLPPDEAFAGTYSSSGIVMRKANTRSKDLCTP